MSRNEIKTALNFPLNSLQIRLRRLWWMGSSSRFQDESKNPLTIRRQGRLSEMVYWTHKNSKAGLLDFQRRPQENISLCKNLFSNAGKNLQFIYYIFKGLIAKQRRANYLGQATPALDACQGRYLQKPKLLLNEFKISFGSHD